MKSNNSAKKGYTLMFIAGLFWGTIGPGLQILCNQGLDAIQASFFLQLFAFLFMVPVVLFKYGFKALKVKPKYLIILLVSGVLSEALFDIFYTNAVTRLGVAPAGVLLYTSPLMVMIASRILFKEKLTKYKLISFVVNLVGCFLTVTGGSFEGSNFNLAGVVYALLAAVCYGAISVSGKLTADEAQPEVVTFYLLLAGIVTLIFLSRCWTFSAEVLAPKNFIAGAIVGIVSTSIPFMFAERGLACDVEASKTQIFASVEVIVTAVLGIIMFNQTLNLASVAGIVIVLLSILIMSKE